MNFKLLYKVLKGEVAGRKWKRSNCAVIAFKKYSAWTNIYPSNPSVCRWNSQLGSRVAAERQSGGAQGWGGLFVLAGLLWGPDQGLSSQPDTHTHVRVLSPNTHPDTSLRIPTHTETTQLVGRLKVTESYRYASKLKESDTGATHSHKHEAPALGIIYH